MSDKYKDHSARGLEGLSSAATVKIAPLIGACRFADAANAEAVVPMLLLVSPTTTSVEVVVVVEINNAN